MTKPSYATHGNESSSKGGSGVPGVNGKFFPLGIYKSTVQYRRVIVLQSVELSGRLSIGLDRLSGNWTFLLGKFLVE